jgi:hypothetical protein
LLSIMATYNSHKFLRHGTDITIQIEQECKDIMRLFWPAIPFLATLSAIFIGAFLFDIAGDEVGTNQAIWFFVMTSCIPMGLWLVGYVYEVLFHRRQSAK